MEPFNYSADFHGQCNRYIQLASEDKLTKDDLDKFSNLIKQSHDQLTPEERTKLLDLGRTIELSSHSILGKVSIMVSGLFYHTIYGNPKFTEIIDTVELHEVIPKEYNEASLKKITEFVQKIKTHPHGNEVLYALAQALRSARRLSTARIYRNSE